MELIKKYIEQQTCSIYMINYLYNNNNNNNNNNNDDDKNLTHKLKIIK